MHRRPCPEALRLHRNGHDVVLVCRLEYGHEGQHEGRTYKANGTGVFAAAQGGWGGSPRDEWVGWSTKL